MRAIARPLPILVRGVCNVAASVRWSYDDALQEFAGMSLARTVDVRMKRTFVPFGLGYHYCMYKLKPGIKQDPQRRWQLPDHIFFGHGACHILAGIYLEAAPLAGFRAERIIPGEGYAGNHIFVTNGVLAFDFRGYSCRRNLLAHHTSGWSKVSPPGWHCKIVGVDFDLLETKDLNARKMLGPDQYPMDPRPRALSFLGRFDHMAAAVKSRSFPG